MKTKFFFKNPKFVKSATTVKAWPILRDSSGNELVEIAIVGRSNVGKSSLINHLFQAKGLAKTSATPGKTRLINFFSVNEEVSFVDLPGYGYATVSFQMKKEWAKMIQEYLENRKPLSLILFLFDIRRDPNEEDRMLLDWIYLQNKKVILVLTKVDKVSSSERAQRTRKIKQLFSSDPISFVHYSSTKNEGRQQLIHAIKQQLEDNHA